MKEAVGYLADDGKFFESMDEAEEYEAFNALRCAIDEICTMSPEVFMSVCSSIPNEIRRYINANEAATRYREIQAGVSTEDHNLREDNTQTVLEQPPRIDEPLPDMGSSQFKEAIRQQREIDGIGSRGTDASNVRSSQDMAVRTYTKSTKARLNSSTSNIR